MTGPLVLRGHGDPSLTTADLWTLAEELREEGIKRVEGDLLVDQRFFDEQTTPPAFDQQPNEWATFRAPVSALAVNENTVTLSLELAGSGQRLAAKVSGAVSGRSHLVRYTRRVEDPTLLGGYALRAVLEQVGITVSGDVKAGAHRGTLLASHQSEPLSQLLYSLGKASDNFYAEMIFKSLGGEGHGRPARSADGAEIVTRWLDKIGANDPGVVIKNGSGLFDSNRVTAASTALLLRAAYRDPAIQPEFVAQLAIGGVDGTLHRRFPNERMRRAVRAKTGTLDDAIALSGYVLAPPGRGPVAFSILINNIAGKVDPARHAADKLVEIIARHLWSGEKLSPRASRAAPPPPEAPEFPPE